MVFDHAKAIRDTKGAVRDTTSQRRGDSLEDLEVLDALDILEKQEKAGFSKRTGSPGGTDQTERED